MINKELISPDSIVVVGGSNDIRKPGGKVLKNIIDGKFRGDLYVTNPKEELVQGVKCYKSPEELPDVELAIIAISAQYVPETVDLLTKYKNTKAFIILSAGFSEVHDSGEGKILEQKIVESINNVGGALIGPNCTGVLSPYYHGVFTLPIPKLDIKGGSLVSGSGATASFIMEAGIPYGLTFSSVISLGNCAQMGIEETVKWLDETYNPATSSEIKMFYIEEISDPQKLMKHSASLIRKGCKIVAIKSGSSEAGSRAASSHTGALASPDIAVDALFRKAGIIRCDSREELITAASVIKYKKLIGKNLAIITNAGGPAVMLTDALEKGNLAVPKIEGGAADKLLEKLHQGSSVANPIDFLATGTLDHLDTIIDYVDKEFDNIDGIVVIYGTTGLVKIYDFLDLIIKKIKTSKKPVYPVLPSITTGHSEIEEFINKGGINFPDEVLLGQALSRVFYAPEPVTDEIQLPEIDKETIRYIIDNAREGYLPPESIHSLLDAAGIVRSKEIVVENKDDALAFADQEGFPLVMKVVGPVHKSDVGGVVLNVMDEETVSEEFDRLMQIPDTIAVLMYPMVFGTEVFIGAKREDKFGHLVLCGLGGIFVEVIKDIKAGLAPLSKDEVLWMIENLKGYKILQGTRNQEAVDVDHFAETIQRVAALVTVAPEIFEMDLNPLIGNKKGVTAVDARIRIVK